METLLRTALWRQFGAAIDTLDAALAACPEALWTQRLWSAHTDDSLPPELGEFWYVTYHALFWLDLYLSGSSEEEFAPPAPFSRAELDPAGVPPERIYTKEELRGYLAAIRRKCRATLLALTDEQARRPVAYPWSRGQSISYLELQMYSMRHVQEHAAQLSLFLGQRAVPAVPGWVARAKGEPDGQSVS